MKNPRLPFAAVVAATALNLTAACAAPAAEDPFLWLEEAHSERSMNWVKAQNAKTDGVLVADPRFKSLFRDAKQIVEAGDRIPEPSIIAGQVFNFWQDADHVHGIWRQTSRADFQRPAPNWRTVIDLDALSSRQMPTGSGRGRSAANPRSGAASSTCRTGARTR